MKKELMKLLKINTEFAVYEDIAFWPWTCLEQLFVKLVTLEPKKFQNKDELFVPTAKLGD